MSNSMTSKKDDIDNIDDILIVRKITERQLSSLSDEEYVKEGRYELDLDTELHLLAAEQEAIIKKQQQLLQADERGKQALISEIAAIKEKQEKRAQRLKYRQHALDIERERAKRIALLPPPLPKSVKLLLKKHDEEPASDKLEVQMPDELQAFRIERSQPQIENKENILNPEELEAKQKMENERQIRAQKRFNEALKKDRQKEEYTKTLKQIQNAELLNRREMAKSISSEKKCVPCPLSDKFQTVKRQTDMEEAAEKVFKKISPSKEHVIEDIEGYEDYYENKYKEIDSVFETKMIDCIPDFVKENFEYLLEDESKFQGGKNFSQLDDSSSDILNKAYIQSPPDSDKIDGREKIDLAISHLDELRSNLQTEYDEKLKPLLVAAMEVPKSDKAVETETQKFVFEDKAIETDILYQEITPDTPPITDYENSGVMAFKKRHKGPTLGPFRAMKIPAMHRRDVHFPVPSVSQPERLTPTSWSSSSYCSLGSHVGMPHHSSSGESLKCDICVAEMKELVKNNAFQELPKETVAEKSDKSTTSSEKSKFSEYVQHLAQKYLVAQSTSREAPVDIAKSVPLYSHTDSETSALAFEKKIISKTAREFKMQQESEKPRLVSTQEKIKALLVLPEEVKKMCVDGKKDKTVATDLNEYYPKADDEAKAFKGQDIYGKLQSADSPERPTECSDYELEAMRIQSIQQVLSKKYPRFSLDIDQELIKREETAKALEDKQKQANVVLLKQNKMIAQPYVYHELSTIQEVDSALTAGSFDASLPKPPDASGITEDKETVPKELYKENTEVFDERLKPASLLDPSDTDIAKLAKSIHFIPKTQEKAVKSLEVTKSVSSGSTSDLFKISDSEKPDFSLSLPPSEYLSSFFYSAFVSCRQSTPVDAKSEGKKDIVQSAPSKSFGLSVCYEIASESKIGKDILVSGTLDSAEFESITKKDKQKPSKPLGLSVCYEIASDSQVGKDILVSGTLDSAEFQSIAEKDEQKPSKPFGLSICYEIASDSKIGKDTLVSGTLDSSELKSPTEKDTLVSGTLDSAELLSIQSMPSLEDQTVKKGTSPLVVSKFIRVKEAAKAVKPKIIQEKTSHAVITNRNDKKDAAKFQANIDKDKGLIPKLKDNGNYVPSSVSAVISHIGVSDSSGSGTFYPLVPCSYVSSPGSYIAEDQSNIDKNKGTRRKYLEVLDMDISDPSGSGIMRSMVPCSYVSSPSPESYVAQKQSNIDRNKGFDRKYLKVLNRDFSDLSGSGEMRSMIPCSYVSSPSPESYAAENQSDIGRNKNYSRKFIDIKNIEISDPSGSEIFYPLVPCSYVSTPSPGSYVAGNQSKADKNKASGRKFLEVLNMDISDPSGSGIFRSLVPCSYVSTPSPKTSANSNDQTGSSSSSSSGNFKPMIPCSYVSSPSENFNSSPQSDNHASSSSSENFYALTPTSMVSSPSMADNETESKFRKGSSGSSEIHPVTFRLDILTDSVSSGNINNQSKVRNNIVSQNYNVTLKTPVPNFTKSFKKSEQNKGSEKSVDSEKEIYHVTESKDCVYITFKGPDEKNTKEKAKVSPSDFFVPQLSEDDLCKYEVNDEKCVLRKSSSENINENNPESAFPTSTNSDSPVGRKLSEKNQNEPVNFNKNTAENHQENALKISKEFGLKEQDLQKLEMAKIFNKHDRLYATSSTSSSTENLSEISGSKVLHQSTPIKKIEEILQEPGILEEPTLTLINLTEYSCQLESESPEKQGKSPSPNPTLQLHNEERNSTLISSPNECNTPTNQSPQLLGSAETPSLLSFLQHESSCTQADDIPASTSKVAKSTEFTVEESEQETLPKASKAVKSTEFTPGGSEKEMLPKEVQRNQFPQSEYKQRTRRLWNNLEEVKKKNLADEKKKLMVVNRLKAKEYSKKLTPKKKN